MTTVEPNQYSQQFATNSPSEHHRLVEATAIGPLIHIRFHTRRQPPG